MVRRPPTLSLSIAALCCAIWALWAWLARDRQASVAPSPPPSSFDEAHVDAHTSLALFRPAVAADSDRHARSTPRAALRLKWVPTAPSSGMSPGASTAAAATAHATAQSRHALPGLTAEHAVTPDCAHELHVGEGLLTGMLRRRALRWSSRRGRRARRSAPMVPAIADAAPLQLLAPLQLQVRLPPPHPLLLALRHPTAPRHAAGWQWRSCHRRPCESSTTAHCSRCATCRPYVARNGALRCCN